MAAPALKALRVPAQGKHTATILFLHGLGDTGMGWSFLADMLSDRMPHCAFVFPHAPIQPVTVNGGMSMPSWYDIKELGPSVSLDRQEDEAGLLKSANAIQSLINAEVDAGIDTSRIVLGGFSQGGAVSYLTALKSERRLAGVVTLSTYMPLRSKIGSMMSDISKSFPWFAGHGEADPVVPFNWGQLSANKLKELGVRDVTFRGYPRVQHSANDQELEDVAQFLERVLPANESAP